jgi:hypothetical protein
MKYIITESQYRIISEQFETMPGNSTRVAQTLIGRGGRPMTTHDSLATAAAVASLFTGGLGYILPIVFGTADAGLYFSEGDTKTASVVGGLSLLPFVGKVVSKIPGVKELGTKGMALLANKLSSGTKLTNLESQVVKGISENKALITQELETASTKLKPVAESIQSLKPKYISKFGQQAYDVQLGKFLRNEIGKDDFIKILSSNKKSAVVQGVKGVTMTSDEIGKITTMAQKTVNGQNASGVLSVNVNGEAKDIVINFTKMGPKDGPVAVAGLTKNWGPQITFYVKKLPKDVDEVRRIIYHEVTHIKDQTPQFMKQNVKTGEYYVTGSGTPFANKADEFYKKAKQIKLNTPKGQELPKEYYDLVKKGDELFSKYEYSPSERLANNQMIFNSIPDKINSVIKNYSSRYGKKKAVEVLNSILTFLKGGGGNIDNVIGARQVEYINNLKKVDLKKYNDLIKKIFQEVENVKAQL